ncbi:MAG: chemotaxis protein CheW [Candidatus Eremiobacteraeota bacterium]|nr:chemotaxis protein CheW [Candidatus Eremiobacteraeota bacterium]
MSNAALAHAESELPLQFSHSHLLARIDRFTLAIPIGSVISIHEAPLIFPAPCAQAGIMGAIRFQGIAVPVFDLRRSLRLPAQALRYSDRLVLLDVGVRIMAVIVDDVLEFASLDPGSMTPADELFGDTPVNGKIIAGIACAPQLCAIIDPQGLVQPDVWDADTIQSVFEQPVSDDPAWAARTALLAEIPKPGQISGVEAAIFQIAQQRFGVPLEAIIEFFTDAVHSPIPIRTGVAVSLLNRRGEAMMLFDPRPILGLPPAPLPQRVDGIVLGGDHCKIALPVDRLEGLGLLPRFDASIKPGRFCLSVHPSDRGAVLLLDVAAFLHSAQSAFAVHPAPTVNATA